MATSNGPVRAKRRASPNRDRAAKPASKRPRKPVGDATKVRHAIGDVADAAPEKTKQLGEKSPEFPLKSVLIGVSIGVMVTGVGLLLGRLWTRC